MRCAAIVDMLFYFFSSLSCVCNCENPSFGVQCTSLAHSENLIKKYLSKSEHDRLV
jgi:hypothetical protein